MLNPISNDRKPVSNDRRSNEVAPDTGDGGNQGGSDADKDKQGDCQRAKQVPMNPPAGTWNNENLVLKEIFQSRRIKKDGKRAEIYSPD